VKNERCAELMRLQKKIVRKRNAARVGSSCDVLVESPAADDRTGRSWTARASFQAPEIDGNVRLRGSAAPGQFVRARITGYTDYDLIAQKEQD
jgi:tRNA A37 methylthiotransferase MiaB